MPELLADGIRNVASGLTGLLGASDRGPTARWNGERAVIHRALTPGREPEFRRLGYNRRRPFFPHRLYFLPRAGPGSLTLAKPMCGVSDPGSMRQVLLHAMEPVLGHFPQELFFDDRVVWHRQHLGLPGHVAFAYLAADGKDLYGLNYISDVVQRIGRRRELKSQVEKRFRGWACLLMNGILALARERGYRAVYSPTAEWVMEHTDASRTVGAELFERIYDRDVQRFFRARAAGRWWRLDVAANADRVVTPEKRVSRKGRPPTVCVCHDIERGWGHRDVDPGFAAEARVPSSRALDVMLSVEDRAGVTATYHVLGRLFSEVRGPIEERGHGIAFHSYDHRRSRGQLDRCREVDLRVAGYRPPRSRLTWELRDPNLLRHDFQWLAAGEGALDRGLPGVENGVVKLPIALDDFPLHTGATSYRDWEGRLLRELEEREFFAFSLHDCYADHWLPGYEELLSRLPDRARLATLDEVANELLLETAL